ncbi:ATP-grasp domain-containing protein [Hansschlegelia sp. KR7-227]|uniref:ATP-grasp domain-containing protein n=1 Tax=Hansschlegelia sp. KR7-227 TaxID=3400914 RepID=UPI003BFE9DF8
MRASSRSDALDVAVVALSARALARSARRAGLRALAVDLFADADTCEHAALAVRSPAGRRGVRFTRAGLLATLKAHAPEGLPVVFGAGLEHAPSLMAEIGRRHPIRGASPDTVARLKDPESFARLLSDLDVAHPRIRTGGGAPRGHEWLSKRAGASGGGHIRSGVGHGRPTAAGRYLQERVPGRSISALFLADGRASRIVGFSEQWPDPTPRSPFRYGGAVGPVALPGPLVAEVARTLDGLVAATGLVGLASADLIVPDGAPGAAFWVLEINPRPGATLDVFDQGAMPSLLGLHLDACSGRLPHALPEPACAYAAAVVYAERPVSTASLPRPVWTADWPSCDETVPAGAPVCTIAAAGASPQAARALVSERRAALLTSIRAAQPAPTNLMVSA